MEGIFLSGPQPQITRSGLFDTAPADLRWYFVDFETHYTQDYSIRKLDPPSYILDERFEALCLGVAEGGEEPYLLHGYEIPEWISQLPDDIAMVSHNALFDMAILSWRYGYRPRVIVDTVAMARTLLGHKFRRVDLDTLATYYNMTKGDVLKQTKGLRYDDFVHTPLWNQFTEYCLQDVRICRTIAQDLIPQLPAEELALMDIVAGCAVDPALRVDVDILAEHHGDILLEKDRVFEHALRHGLADKDQLMSNEQFAELLRSKGVEPPTKISTTTGERTYAFAKKDPDFLALQEHDDPGVVAIVEARLTFKSTIEETRSQRMINIASLDFPHHGGTGLMPIPLMVGAAHTHRLGGGWKLNPQNWGRNSPIRRAILAPEGFQIIAADSAQIEARMNAWFCDQLDLVEQFAKGEDVYALFASDIYREPVTKASNPRARQVGKTGILQLGYQSGWNKFKDTLWVDTYSDPDGAIDISDEEAVRVVKTYRSRYRNISNKWYWLHNICIPILAGNATFVPSINEIVTDLTYGPVTFRKGEIEGPTGLKLYYDELRDEDGEWRFKYGHETNKKLYGGKVLENIIQFLARCVVMSAAVRLKRPLARYNSRLTHSSHDEIVYLVPNEHVDPVKALLRTEMNRAPDWAPTLPLSCEIGVAANYADAK